MPEGIFERSSVVAALLQLKENGAVPPFTFKSIAPFEAVQVSFVNVELKGRIPPAFKIDIEIVAEQLLASVTVKS